MKIAIVCATPYQTLNALNLSCNVLCKKMDKDLFYKIYSPESQAVLNNIQSYNAQYKIWDNIYPYQLLKKERSLTYYINDLVQAIYPNKYVTDAVTVSFNIKHKKYDYITITSATDFEIALTRIFPNAETLAYDDGLGSYIGDIVHDNDLKLIWKILGRRKDKIWPKLLYVNNVSFCRSSLTPSIKALPTLVETAPSYRVMISHIFNYNPSDQYTKHPFIFLTQPFNELGTNIFSLSKALEHNLVKYKPYVLVRIHPRDNSKLFLDWERDNTHNLWELVCKNDISDSHILVSICSSAQIMPKVLFNKEPYLIFLYRLFPSINQNLIKYRILPIIELVKEGYTNKNKIYVPSNFDELISVLNSILQ